MDRRLGKVDGTILDKDLNELFKGTDHDIMNWILKHPVIVDQVWISDEPSPISIDDWVDAYDRAY